MPTTVDLGIRTIAAQGGVYGPGVVEVPNQEIKEQLEARMKELEENEARQSGAVPIPEVPASSVATTISESETDTGEDEEGSDLDDDSDDGEE